MTTTETTMQADTTPDPASRDHLLRVFVADRSVPCPGCSYDLRGLTATRCPECNQELVLRVGLAEPRLGAFLGALIGLATGVGFSGLLFVYFILVFSVRRRGGSPGGTFFLSTLVPFLIEAPVLWLLIRTRAAFTRAAPATRIIIVIGAWLLTAINVIVFSFFVR